jgi:hypothetical protein
MGLLTATLVLASLGNGLPAAAAVPLPRPRPPIVAEPAVAVASDHGPPTDCDKRLATVAVYLPKPTLTGPGGCGGPDLVEVDAVLLPDGSRVAVEPKAMLRCDMAESLAAWLRDEVVPRLKPLNSPLRAIENADSYECRGRNRVVGAPLSEHGRANALDVRAFKLANGHSISLTDRTVPRDLRETVLHSACARFSTVLGPGSDWYHEDHIHLDLMERRNNYRICQWNVYDPLPQTAPLLPAERPEEAPPREVAAKSDAAKPEAAKLDAAKPDAAEPEPKPAAKKRRQNRRF